VTPAASRPVRTLLAALLAAAAVLAGLLAAPPASQAARGMEVAIQDDELFIQGNKRFRATRPSTTPERSASAASA
jgi:hypothetical protein